MMSYFWRILSSICDFHNYSIVPDSDEYCCHETWTTIKIFEFHLSLFNNSMSTDYKFVDKPYLTQILHALSESNYENLITCYTHNHWWVIIHSDWSWPAPLINKCWTRGSASDQWNALKKNVGGGDRRIKFW